GRGVYTLMRGHFTNNAGKTQILHNKSIWTQWQDVFQHFPNFSEFIFKDHHIEGEVYFNPVEVGQINHLFKVSVGEVLASSSSIKIRHTHVDGIGPMVNGGQKHIHVPNGE